MDFNGLLLSATEVILFALFQYGDGSIDTEAQGFLYRLKNETVPGVLHPSNIKDFTVSWGPGITLEQHADYLR